MLAELSKWMVKCIGWRFMADIFLSYAREDEARARALAVALESRGWSVFWDRRIPHGRDFTAHIEQQLDSARCIVVLWSSASIKSKFVRDEATEGLNDGRLVPALMEAVRQPLGFRGLQAANLADWTGAETTHDEFERLVSSIGEMVPPFVQAVPSTSVEVATSTGRGRTEHQANPGGTDVRAADIPSVDRGPQSASPPARVGERVHWPTRIKQQVFQPAGGVIAAMVLVGLLCLVIWRWVVDAPGAEVTTGPVTGALSPPADAKVPRAEADQSAPMWMPAFIEIAAGPFTMGSDKKKDPRAYDDELPQHQVTLPAFFIGRDEVTVGQFKACAGEGGCKPSDKSSLLGPDNLPVRYVSWHEAIAYCVWLENKLKSSRATPANLADVLAGRSGGGAWHVTLPSEAEWEKATRGTDGRTYPWGDRVDPTKTNYADAQRGGPTAVGSFPGGNSPYAVRDVSGNVSEWTRSHYKPYPYRPDDGRENLTAGDDVYRVVRGGSYFVNERLVRAAYRVQNSPGRRGDFLGFRVVVSPFQP